ncbi:facilitated trehalose transporter Tret1-like [Agrilus planipennis]|uniref:Facilitated trehalose transporter Tret1-like n=1 Tax=Agrilus planipennis TaxID=224129 RepID=A0A1W4WCG0_AGRPL|nr:facilitated trehalose transporter Tret1-like [Agrilus planipennis]
MKISVVRNSWLQILAAFTGSIGTINDGMQYGWSAPIIPKLRQEDSPIKISKGDEGLIENVYMVGGIFGILAIAIYTKFMGRKPIIILAAIKHLVAWTLIATTKKIEVLYLARFIAGAAGNITFVSLPIYIAEIADESIRGFLGTFFYINMHVGILIIYFIAPFTSIVISSSVGIACVILQVVTFSFMPETPYYHINKGNQKAALNSLQIFRRKDDVYDELKDITNAVQRQESEKRRITDVFMVKSNLKAFTIAAALVLAQHFSGISVFIMNLHVILEDAESVVSPTVAPIIVAVTMLFACIAASFLVDRLGRKILLVSSSILTGLSLAVLAIYFYVKNTGGDISHVSWIPLASVTLYFLFNKFGIGLVPIVLFGELFPTSIKTMTMATLDIWFSILALASICMFMEFKSLYGMHVPFFIFAGLCLVTALFCQFFIPETKGKTLEEIQMMLKGL